MKEEKFTDKKKIDLTKVIVFVSILVPGVNSTKYLLQLNLTVPSANSADESNEAITTQ